MEDIQRDSFNSSEGMAGLASQAGICGMQGDTVNLASRMESSGFPMTVHVSEAFVKHIRNPALFVQRGPRTIKGKGDMLTYLAKVCPYQGAISCKF